MKYITIRFIYTPGIVSKLIAWNTNSLWCHTEALSRDQRSWIGAHGGPGVEKRPLNWCRPSRERRYSLPVSDAQYDQAMSWLEAHVGEPYDYKDIIGLAIHARIGSSNHTVICSAFMLQFLIQADFVPLNVQDEYIYLITPETLHLSPIFRGHCTYAVG